MPTQNVLRAFMVGINFGRISNLGKPYSEICADVFRTVEQNPTNSIADRLVSQRFAQKFGPYISTDVEEVSLEDEHSVLECLAKLVEGDDPFVVSPPGFPFHAFCASSQPVLNELGQEFVDVVDTHLHSGAAISLGKLLELLCTQPDAIDNSNPFHRTGDGYRDADATWIQDSDGSSYLLPPLLGAIRLSIARFKGNSDWTLGRPISISLFSSGRFWRAVSQACAYSSDALVDGVDRGDFYDELVGPLNVETFVENPIDTVREAVLKFRNEIYDLPENLVGLLASVTLLNVGLSSKEGEGLRRFVSRFSSVGRVLDRVIGTRSDVYVESAAASVFASSRVVGAEFRKSFVFSSRRSESAESALIGALNGHVDGVTAFCLSNDRSVRFSMPACFVRMNNASSDVDGYLTPRASLMGIERLTNALVATLSSSEHAGMYLTGIDLVGDEDAAPSWSYMVAFEHLRRHTDLNVAIHAGETFATAMTGVRRVGELFTPQFAPDRIGHALALDGSSAEHVARGRRVPTTRWDLVADLAWLASTFGLSGTVEAALQRVVLDWGFGAFGVGTSDITEAWDVIHSLDSMVSRGLISTNSGLAFTQSIDRMNLSYVDPVTIAAYLMTHRTAAGDPFAGRVGERVGRLYGVAVDDHLVRARESVIERVKSGQVVVESCLTSNLRLAGIPRAEDHPLGRFVDDHDLRVTLSSDDPIVFGTDVSLEHLEVERVFGREFAIGLASRSIETTVAHSSLPRLSR